MQYNTRSVCAVYSRTNGRDARDDPPRRLGGDGCSSNGSSSSSGAWVAACGYRRRRRVAAAGHNNNIYSAALKAPRKEESVINYLRVAYRTRPFPRPCAQIIQCRRCVSEGTTAIQHNIILYTTLYCTHQSASHRRRLYSRGAAKETLI